MALGTFVVAICAMALCVEFGRGKEAVQISYSDLPAQNSLPEYVILSMTQGKLYCVREVEAECTSNNDACAKADILLLIDTSSSVEETFIINTIVPGLKKFAGKFNIGDDAVRFAAITFGSTSKKAFHFRRGSNLENIMNELDQLELIRGNTATYGALHGANNAFAPPSESYKNIYKARLTDDVAKIIIIFTDGQASHVSITNEKADMLKEIPGIDIYAVGIGNNINTTMLNKIASSGAHVLIRSNYNSFDELLDTIASGICASVD